jgi:hypothetical protein
MLIAGSAPDYTMFTAKDRQTALCIWAAEQCRPDRLDLRIVGGDLVGQRHQGGDRSDLLRGAAALGSQGEHAIRAAAHDVHRIRDQYAFIVAMPLQRMPETLGL